MTKLIANTKDGHPLLVLVLEPGNLHRLQKREPIVLRLEELFQDLFPNGIPLQLEMMIDYSETPVTDAREFAKYTSSFKDERTPIVKNKRPHCPECQSTIEQMGMTSDSNAPVRLVFCPVCGCVLGTVAGEKP